MAGGMCGRGGVHGRGACVAGGLAWHTVNEQAVRILLECILVVLSQYQNMLDTDVCHINLNSLHHDKCESAFKLIHQVNLFNLIP